MGRILIIGTALGWSGSVARSDDIELRAPLSGVATPSATYGELSPGIGHPGVDLPTGGQSLEISAAADGEIVRVRISTTGYGRALNLLLPDGREIVYAHLSMFMPAIEESSLARQERSASFELDWGPPRGTFPVLRGEFIGKTGENEDGRRVLHLEVRVDGAPRNPLRAGFRFADSTRPRIEALRFLPLGPSARINGGLDPVEIPLDLIADRTNPAARLVLWGPVGVESVAHDDALGQQRSPWQTRLDVDGALQFEGDVGERVVEGRWGGDSPEPVAPDRFVQRLYRPAERDRGRLACGSTIKQGFHRLRVVSRDAAGLADTVNVGVLVRPTPRLDEWVARPCGAGLWDVGIRIDPIAGGNPEAIRLWVDQTEDGRRFPVSTPLGHIGSQWFLGDLSSIIPSGRIGIRLRLRTPDGIEAWEPALTLDPAGGCGTAVIDSPLIIARPRWLDIRAPIACVPAAAPTAELQIPGGTIACDLLEIPPDEGEEGLWRWVAAPGRARAGATPYLDLRLDGSTRRWRLGSVVLATPGADLLWSSPDGALTVEVPAATFYGPVWLVWTKAVREDERIPTGEISGLPHARNEQVEILLVRSDVHRLSPEDLEVDGPFRVSIRPTVLPTSGEEAKRLAIYTRPGPGRTWRYIGGIWTGSAMVAIADALGEWILLEDRSEPWVYALDPTPGDRRMGPLSSLRASVREDGSGLDPSGVEIELDGKRLPSAWMPVSRTAIAMPAVPIAEGIHQWEVRVRDRAGNIARRTASFSVVR